MNTRQLRQIGVPDEAIPQAITCLQLAISSGAMRGKDVKAKLKLLVEEPTAHQDDPLFGSLAKFLVEEAQFVRPEPASYRTWGTDIDEAAHAQMRQSCALPMAVGGALMPDAHLGYGLPIGGVLALEGAVVPYAVGVDIACRMKLSVLDVPVSALDDKFPMFQTALEKGTRFGVGSVHEKPIDHAVLDEDWTVTKITREHKDKARKQLGTSGSGNHFVEFGQLTLPQDDAELGLKAGEYVALMSHSGSRGPGAAVCSTYSNIARAQLPKRYEDLGRLAWLDLDSEEGQEYWAAMNLMGQFAAANHDVIHRLVSSILGALIIGGVENHHNFAWKEMHNGKELIVHRKGATPAAKGELGVIPGSMADPAYIVRGRGVPESFNSASHGAGRAMSRTKAKEKYTWNAVRKDLEKKGIRVLSAGADEVPYAYKNIQDVMRAQADLVDIVGRFNPKIVKMCDDGSAAED